MRASGQDKRGQGGAKATIVSRLRQQGDTTRVEVETDLKITGRLARFGRGGMIQDVSNRLLQDFAECLQKTIEAAPPPPQAERAETAQPLAPAQPAPGSAGPPAAPPVKGFSLLMSVLWERLKRLFRR